MVTTIQLDENVKKALDRMKSGRETYEEVIVNMMRQIEQNNRSKHDLLIEGYSEIAEESLKITQEFEAATSELNWEW